MVGVSALELGLQLLVHVRVRLGARVERLVFDHPEAGDQGVRLVGAGVSAVRLSGVVVAHGHEYSSGDTRSP
jgi:hypothetical protein